ncbi:MAG: sulfatase-like hydrolase/transferase [Bryobacteraceae bacterium]
MRLILLLALACLQVSAAASRKTRNVILVTADGLRWQELFSGIDAALMNEEAAGMVGKDSLRDRLWRPEAEARRAALMPFFWNEFVPQGVALGNAKRGSSVQVTNRYRVSYPGYSEILTGRDQDAAIQGNREIQNPSATVLEFLREKLALDSKRVALFASWSVFHFIGEQRPGSIFVNAGFRELGGAHSRKLSELSRLQFRILTPWDTVRHDYITFEMALEYLRTVKPRVLYIALGETDDWAHDKRYDRTLQTIQYFDQCLRDLAAAIDALPEYRGNTSVIVTTDHGRGGTLADWNSHGAKVEGAERIWMAIRGPDTPATGEARDVPAVYQRDVAPTILDLMGIDYREMTGVLGKPVPLATGR